MDAKITRIEVLLDKLNLLFAQVKEDGHLDKLERELMQKYTAQLVDLLDEKPFVTIPPISKPELKKEDTVIPPVMQLPTENELPETEHKKPEAIIPETTPEIIAPKHSIMPEAIEEVSELKQEKIAQEETQEIPPVQENKVIREVPKDIPVKKPLVKSNADDHDPEEYNTGLNSKLSGQANKKTLADKIISHKAKDLKSIIDLNERILLTKGLFANDKEAYEAAIKSLNAMTGFPEAEKYITQHLQAKYGWKDKEAVAHLIEVVRLKFS